MLWCGYYKRKRLLDIEMFVLLVGHSPHQQHSLTNFVYFLTHNVIVDGQKGRVNR